MLSLQTALWVPYARSVDVVNRAAVQRYPGSCTGLQGQA